MMTVGIPQLFRSMAGADWLSQGGLSAAEFGAALKERAGADLAFSRSEFRELGKDLGLSRSDSRSVFEFLENNGQVSVGALRDKLLKSAGADRAFNLDELTGGVERLVDQASQDRCGAIGFRRDAGADRAMNADEFKAIAERAGIEDEEKIQQVFEQVAGADGEISRDEFEAAFGDTRLSTEDFRQKFDELAENGTPESDGCGCSEPEETEEGSNCAPSQPSDSSCSESQDVWSHEVKDGKATIRLGDQYTITAEENGSAVTIKNNETGAETRIWGDPHFDKRNDGSNDFDFKKDLSLQLDDGTKITIGTVDAGNGTTLASSLTITNGDNSIQVTGLGGDKDGANNLKVVQSNAGETVDDLTWDGEISLFEGGWDWLTSQGQSVTQAIINEAEA